MMLVMDDFTDADADAAGDCNGDVGIVFLF